MKIWQENGAKITKMAKNLKTTQNYKTKLTMKYYFWSLRSISKINILNCIVYLARKERWHVIKIRALHIIVSCHYPPVPHFEHSSIFIISPQFWPFSLPTTCASKIFLFICWSSFIVIWPAHLSVVNFALYLLLPTSFNIAYSSWLWRLLQMPFSHIGPNTLLSRFLTIALYLIKTVTLV